MKKYILISMNIIAILCFIIGLLLLYIQGINREYVYDHAKVIDVQDTAIKVEAGEQNGEPIIYEINKPLYKELRNGDYVSLKIKNGIPEYTINRDLMLDISIKLIKISCIYLYLHVAYNIINSICIYKNSNNKKNGIDKRK